MHCPNCDADVPAHHKTCPNCKTMLKASERDPVANRAAGPARRAAATTADSADLAAGNVRLAQQLAEARQQQAATREILRVIGESHTDVQPVFETLAENAVRLCGAEHASIWRVDGQLLRVVVTYNVSAERRAFIERSL